MKKIELNYVRVVAKTDTSIKPGPDSGIGAGTGSNKPKPKN